MRPWTALPLVLALSCAAPDAGPEPAGPAPPEAAPEAPDAPASELELGAFSVSLAVQDLAASRAFYEQLGFEAAGGMPEQGWLILRNGSTVIGLFQGMFEQNILTFNPGWTQQATELESFTDVRELQRILKERGVPLQVEADTSTDGPASFFLLDPDGNPILVDQHVARPD